MSNLVRGSYRATTYTTRHQWMFAGAGAAVCKRCRCKRTTTQTSTGSTKHLFARAGASLELNYSPKCEVLS